ncbi:hypothetical protein Hanom_Chr16g01475271 [Helianthus anomalus]
MMGLMQQVKPEPSQIMSIVDQMEEVQEAPVSGSSHAFSEFRNP